MEHQQVFKRKICGPCRNCYKAGCRCVPCGQANNEAEKNNARNRRRPEIGWDNPRVDPRPAAAHLQMLKDHGIPPSRIAKIMGVGQHMITEITRGKRKFILKNREREILALTVESDPLWGSGILARERLIWLGTMGVSTPEIAKITGLSAQHLKEIRRTDVKRIRRSAYDKLMRISPNSVERRPHVASIVKGYYESEAA